MPDHAPYRRILAVKLADLGDLLTITPALQGLRAAYPFAQIDLLTPPSSARLLQGAPYLDSITTFDKFPFDSLKGLLDARNVVRTLRFLFQLRLSHYDAIILFHHLTTHWGTVKFAILSMASGAKVRAGLDNGRGGFLTHRVEDRGFGAMHEVEYWLQVAALLGVDAHGGWNPHLPMAQEHRAFATSLLEGAVRPLVALHPGAGRYSLARIWPVERFAQVARGLVKSHGARLVILGGPDEVRMAAELERLVGEGRALNLAGRTSIHETAAVIERCDLFLGNDSGPMHIAAAVRTPVVAVFGPSNARAWGPYTPATPNYELRITNYELSAGEAGPHRVVSRDLPCVPCFYRGHSLGLRHGCGPRPCLTGLSPEPVLRACQQVLEEVQSSRFQVPSSEAL